MSNRSLKKLGLQYLDKRVKISEDTKNSIRKELALPHRLSYQKIADKYGVSTMAVRCLIYPEHIKYLINHSIENRGGYKVTYNREKQKAHQKDLRIRIRNEYKLKNEYKY